MAAKNGKRRSYATKQREAALASVEERGLTCIGYLTNPGGLEARAARNGRPRLRSAFEDRATKGGKRTASGHREGTRVAVRRRRADSTHRGGNPSQARFEDRRSANSSRPSISSQSLRIARPA